MTIDLDIKAEAMESVAVHVERAREAGREIDESTVSGMVIIEAQRIANRRKKSTDLVDVDQRRPPSMPLPSISALLGRPVDPEEYEAAQHIELAPDVECETCRDARFVRGRKTGDGRFRVDGMPEPVREVLPCPECNGWSDGELLQRSNIDPRYQAATFETFRPEEGKQDALEAVQVWAYSVLAGETQSLLLRGGVGRGKTHLAVAATRWLCEQGVRAYFVRVLDVLNRSRAAFGDGEESFEAITQAMSEVPVLVLDDLGAAKPSPWVRETVPWLIESRLMAMRPTVVTSDKDARWLLDAGYDERFISRLGGHDFQIVEVSGADMRRVVS